MADTLALSLDESRPLSLQQQLYTRLREDILMGRLRPGEKLPATRALAGQLAVSRTTAVVAYEQLLAEGYIEARRGAGTFVSRQLPDDTLRAESPAAPGGANGTLGTGRARAAVVPPRHATRRLSRWGDRLRASGGAPFQG